MTNNKLRIQNTTRNTYSNEYKVRLGTNCEIVWVKLQLTGSVPLHIAAYYKPSESDPDSFEEFRKSVELVSPIEGHVWILGDFNYPKSTWNDCVPVISPDCKYTRQYEDFSDLLNEFNLTQVVTQPTRNENILELFLIDNPTLVMSVEVRPGIADHDVVLSEVFIKPQTSRQKPILMYLYKKTDWEGLETHVLEFQKTFKSTCDDKSVNSLWEDFKRALQSGLEQYAPQRSISPKPSLPWITQDIKRTMRKPDSLYDKYKKHRRPADRQAHLEFKHLVNKISRRPTTGI